MAKHDKQPDHVRRTGPAPEAMYRLMLWLIPAVEKLPRSQKFLLGDRIQSTALDVLERLIEATYTRAQRPALLEANSRLADCDATVGANARPEPALVEK